jgi:hypothetical protein
MLITILTLSAAKTSQQSISIKPKQPTKVIYSPTGRVLLIMTKGGNISFFKIQQRDDGKEEWVLSPDKLKTNENEVCIHLSPRQIIPYYPIRLKLSRVSGTTLAQQSLLARRLAFSLTLVIPN